MIDRSRVIVVTNYYRPVIFYELTIKKLIKHGYKNFLVQNTGGDLMYRIQAPIFQGANVKIESFPANMAYYPAMENLKRTLTPNLFPGADIILFLDNDCFCTPEGLDRYVELFLEGSYDWTSYFPGKATADLYFSGPSPEIIEVKNQKVYRGSEIPANSYHPSCPDISPFPHYENSYMLLKRSVWDQMTPFETSHGCRFIDAVHTRLHGKIGALNATYAMPSYIQKGNGWVHLLGMMYVYCVPLGEGRIDRNVLLSGEGIHKARLGMFALWEKWFGRLRMPLPLLKNLNSAYGVFGGADACLATFQEACEGSFILDEGYWKQ